MNTSKKFSMPSRGTVGYLIGKYLYMHGPTPENFLLDFALPKIPRAQINNAINTYIGTKWFALNANRLICAGENAIRHFDDTSTSNEDKAVGEVAAPRIVNVMNRPSLSTKYRINPQGSRADIPAFSIRENFRSISVGG